MKVSQKNKKEIESTEIFTKRKQLEELSKEQIIDAQIMRIKNRWVPLICFLFYFALIASLAFFVGLDAGKSTCNREAEKYIQPVGQHLCDMYGYGEYGSTETNQNRFYSVECFNGTISIDQK